jgi:hypothetical protein
MVSVSLLCWMVVCVAMAFELDSERCWDSSVLLLEPVHDLPDSPGDVL